MYIYKTRISQFKQSITGVPAIYGIGKKSSKLLIATSGIGSRYRVRQLSHKKQYLLSEAIRKGDMKVSIDLKKEVLNNIQHHLEIRDYRGNRHRLGYPVHGQRTRSNGRTQQKLGPRRIKSV